MFPRFDREEVAKHCTESDCWIIIDGAVLDVTRFLNQHPGGISAISKTGRAGKDVTTYFEKVGHSPNAQAILATLQIGIVEYGDIEATGEMSSLLRTSDEAEQSNDHDYSVKWHALRRQAILRDHPDIADLMGSNPWTCVIGVIAVVLHCYICILVQADSCPWYMAVILAYTI